MSPDVTGGGAPLDFGLMFFASSESDSPTDKYRAVIEAARFADRHGFSAVWLPERHFTDLGCLYPNPAVLHAALARETSRVGLRAGSVVLPLHDPIRVAEEWAAVDNLSGGRVGVSFASGWHPNDFVFFPDRYANRQEETIRGIELVRRLWRGELHEAWGGDGTRVKVRIYPTPLQPELPVWLTSAGSVRTIVRAGEIGANLLTHLFDQDVQDLADKIAVYRQALADNGHDPARHQVTVMLHTYVGERLDQVREEVRQPYCSYLKANADLLAKLAYSRGQAFDPSRLSEAEVDQVVNFVFERFFGERALMGTPESCAPLVMRLHEIGVDEIACFMDFGVERELVLRSLPHLAALKDLCQARLAEAGPSRAARAEPAQVAGEPAAAQPAIEPPAGVAARCPEEVSAADLYDRLAAGGVTYGPPLQTIERLRRGDREALAELRAPAGAALDACLLTLATTLPAGALYLPASVGSVRVNGRISGRTWCHAVLRSEGPEDLAGDAAIVDESGHRLVEVAGVRFRKVETGDGGRQPLEDLLYEVRWEPSPAPDAGQPAGDRGPWLVLADAGGVGERLAGLLRADGARCFVARPGPGCARTGEDAYEVDPASPDHFERLFAEVTGAAGAVPGLVHLWALDARSPETTDAAGVEADQVVAAGGLLSLVQARAAGAAGEAPGTWCVTRGAQAVEPGDAVPGLAQAPLWGLGRAAGVEQPQLGLRLVDLDPAAPPGAAAEWLLAALRSGDAEDQVAMRGGQRYVPRLARRRQAGERARRLEWRPDRSYLVSGGLGVLGLLVARWMVDKGARWVILLSRTALPPRSEWDAHAGDGATGRRIAAIRDMEARGAHVALLCGDVADEQTLGMLLDALGPGELPPLAGVVHTAGVLEDAGLLELDVRAIRAVSRPKVAGAWLLHRLARDASLDFFVLFSSAAALLPAPGQGAYAAAHAFLDALAHHRRAQGLPALAVDWGAWADSGTMSTAGGERLSRYLSVRGIRAIPQPEGLAVLGHLLEGEAAQAVAVPISWQTLFRIDEGAARSPLLSELAGEGPGPDEEAGLGRRRLLEADPAERPGLLASLLRERAARLLGLLPEQLDAEEPLDRAGFDSLMAIQLKNWIETTLGVEVPVVTFLEGGSVAHLTARLAELLPEEPRSRARLAEPDGAAAGPFPLSHGQEALWFLYQLAPASVAYNEPFAWRIRAPVEVEALGRALQAVVDRHPSLRTTYRMLDGRPVQEVQPELEVVLQHVWLAGAGDAELRATLLDEAEVPFDLASGPVLRAGLFSRSPADHVLLLTVHHIAIDFWSMNVMLEELVQLYVAELSEQSAALPRPAAEYRDYVRWQSDMLAGPAGERLWAHWRQQLAGELPVLRLPTDRPRPPVQTYRGAAHFFDLDRELTGRLRRLAGSEGTTLYTTALAAFQTLLHRWSEQTRFVIGSPVVGRSRSEFERAVGDFINPVVLPADFSGDPTVRAHLRRARDTVHAALEHQDFPFPLLVERLQPPRDASRSPIFQVMMLWERPSFDRSRGGALAAHLEPFVLEQRIAKLDLALMVLELGDGLSCTLQYNTDLFDAGTVERLARGLVAVAEGMVADPDQRVGELPLLSSDERHQLLVSLNDTRRDYEPATVHGLIEAQVRRTPDACAVRFEAESLTYAELDRRANRLAHHLRTLGVGPGAVVGVSLDPSLDMLTGVLGILKAGGAYLPLDPSYPAERLRYMLEDSRAGALLARSRRPIEHIDRSVRVVALAADRALIDRGPDGDPAGGAALEDLAYVIYTSGSTGRPKGVAIPHRAVTNVLRSFQEQLGLTPRDALLAVTTLSFDIAALELFLPLMVGAQVAIEGRAVATSGRLLAERLAQGDVTALQATPATWRLLLQARWPGDRRLTALCGGEALTGELAAQLSASVGALWNVYGPTEATIWSTMGLIDRPGETPPIGLPIANTQLLVLDGRMRPVPVGVPGELHIGGAGLARGYVGQPGQTAGRFVPDPFSPEPGARLYRTGDLVRHLPDGTIQFLGRIDGQVKVNGIRVEPGEVEAVLALSPGVRECAVVAQDDQAGGKRLAAFFVPAGEATWGAPELRAFLKSKVPQHLVPSTFVAVEALPLTPNGKVARRALASRRERPVDPDANAAPRTRIEEQLAQLWAEVLGVPGVGIHSNFFDLGGGSLQAIALIDRAAERGLEISPELLFQQQTVAEQAAELSRLAAGGEPAC